MNGLEIKGRLDRIGKTTLEHFEDIKELEVANEQGLTVKDIVPYKCKQVEKSLKALEIIKEKNVAVALLKSCRTVNAYNILAFDDEYLKANNYLRKLTQEEFNLLKEVLE